MPSARSARNTSAAARERASVSRQYAADQAVVDRRSEERGGHGPTRRENQLDGMRRVGERVPRLRAPASALPRLSQDSSCCGLGYHPTVVRGGGDIELAELDHELDRRLFHGLREALKLGVGVRAGVCELEKVLHLVGDPSMEAPGLGMP
jgi:hypothetical protein